MKEIVMSYAGEKKHNFLQLSEYNLHESKAKCQKEQTKACKEKHSVSTQYTVHVLWGQVTLKHTKVPLCPWSSFSLIKGVVLFLPSQQIHGGDTTHGPDANGWEETHDIPSPRWKGNSDMQPSLCQDCDGVAWSGLKSQSQNLFNLNPQHV